MISRIFHPIGQGAFYSERHPGFNMVYDCGNLKDTGLADKVVRQSFMPSDEVDVLFVSHFDFDHISKIHTLKNHVKDIKTVVLPLLHNDERILLTNIYRILGFSNLTLISDPASYFGESTTIISVASAESDREINSNGVDLNGLISTDIASGTALRSSTNQYDWVFIPFNHLSQVRNSVLETELKNAGFDVLKLKSDANYTVAQVSNARTRRQIKDIYNRLDGKINQNSMLLYSGCTSDLIVSIAWSHSEMPRSLYHCCYECDFERVSCVYTGDTDLNVVDIKSIYSKYWKYVGTIQIPHHGDLKSFNPNILEKHSIACPISVGINNGYGHPSYDVISQILNRNAFPLQVTERLDSGAVQTIDIY